jgi:hypothetical protein
VGVDGEALAVDDDVVVEPARRGEVLRVGVAAVGPAGDVVDLEPIPAGTARNGACCTVTVDDESSQARRDDAAPPTQSQRNAVRCAGGDLNNTVAQDRFDRRFTDPRPASTVTPAWPRVAAASVASTNTVNTGVDASMVAPSPPARASRLIAHNASALRAARDVLSGSGSVSPFASRA